MRTVFTTGHFDSPSYGPLRRQYKGPVYHAGKIVRIRPVWFDSYGAARVGRTGDMIQMLDDLGIKDRSF